MTRPFLRLTRPRGRSRYQSAASVTFRSHVRLRPPRRARTSSTLSRTTRGPSSGMSARSLLSGTKPPAPKRPSGAPCQTNPSGRRGSAWAGRKRSVPENAAQRPSGRSPGSTVAEERASGSTSCPGEAACRAQGRSFPLRPRFLLSLSSPVPLFSGSGSPVLRSLAT